MEQTDNEKGQLSSYKQLGLDNNQCSLRLVNNCAETDESAQLCQEFLDGALQEIVDFDSLTTQLILFSKSHLNQSSVSTTLGSYKSSTKLSFEDQEKRSSDK